MVLLIDGEYERSDVNIETITNNDQNVLRCTKSSFHKIKIFDHKPRSNTFVFQNQDSIKYLREQSLCYLITNNTPKLSNDCLSHMRQQATNR